MSDILFEDLPPRDFLVQLLVPFFVTLFFLQGFRTYVVDIYIALFNILWEGTGEYLPLLALLVFASPLFAIFFHKKIGLRHMIAGSAILTALFVLPLSLGLTYELELFFSTMVVAFYSIFLPFYLYRRQQSEAMLGVSNEAALLSASLILAISYDILFRSLGMGYDVSRILIYFPIQCIFTIIVSSLVFWKLRNPPQSPTLLPEPQKTDTQIKKISLWFEGAFTILGIGTFLFLEHSLLANPYNILRWTIPHYFLFEMTLGLTLSLILMIFPIIVLIYGKLRNQLKIDRWQTIAIGSIFIILAFSGMFLIGGPLFYLVIIAQVFAILNLYTIIRFAIHPKLSWSITILCFAIFVGFLIFLLLDVMFAFTFTYAYLGDIGAIFDGQVFPVILSAALILGITSTYASYRLRRLNP